MKIKKQKPLSKKKKKALKIWWILIIIGLVLYKIISYFVSFTYLPLIFLVYLVGVYVYLFRGYDRA